MESITTALKTCSHYVPNVKKTQHFLSPEYQVEAGIAKIVMGKSLRDKALTKCLECHFLSRKGMSAEDIKYLDSRKYYHFILSSTVSSILHPLKPRIKIYKSTSLFPLFEFVLE